MTTFSHSDIIRAAKHGPTPDLPDPKDIPAGSVFASKKIPVAFSLKEKQSPVQIQGKRGTCTAFCMASLAEYFYMLEAKKHIDLSEEFAFFYTKKYDKADYRYTGSGAYPRSACKALHKKGICTERLLPYQNRAKEDVWKNIRISSKAKKEAKDFCISSYAKVVVQVADIQKAVFSSKAPVMLSLYLYDNYKTIGKNGLWPRKKKAKKIGGHSMLVTGWNKNAFECKNSWGESWGSGGYAYLPFSAVNELVFSVWSFVDAPSKNGTATRPKNQQPALKQNYNKKNAAEIWAEKNNIIKKCTGKAITDYELSKSLYAFYSLIKKNKS